MERSKIFKGVERRMALMTIGTTLLTISVYSLIEILYMKREKIKSVWTETDNIPDSKESWGNE